MTDRDDDTVRHGTTNIFVDLGYADAETHLLKTELVSRIQDRITDCKLTQVQAAAILGIGQPDVSRMLGGRFRDFSVERLMRFLTALGYEVDIVVRAPGHAAKAADTIHVQPAPA